MAFIDTPDPIIASLTDFGRMSFARVAAGEISFEVIGFAVGRGGYLHSNPVKIEPIDPALTDLQDPFFPAVGTKPLSAVEFPLPQTYVANCRLAASEAISALGEIGLWAEIKYSSVDSAEVGTKFMVAVGHFPILTKTYRQALVLRFIIQF